MCFVSDAAALLDNGGNRSRYSEETQSSVTLSANHPSLQEFESTMESSVLEGYETSTMTNFSGTTISAVETEQGSVLEQTQVSLQTLFDSGQMKSAPVQGKKPKVTKGKVLK